jgi:ParB/RepB/Spo0J family partition protein
MAVEYFDPEKIKDNPYQPRRSYSPRRIDELASSIEQNGLLEIPMGRRNNGDIEIAFGHIRKRGFIKLKKKNVKKWPTMPVDIRKISDHEMAVFALEENLKRTDITPIDLARSVTKYFEVFPETTETELAKKLVMTQGHISNMRRVMRLPEEVLGKIDEGRITFTMARELLIFEGLTATGKESRYSRKEERYIDIPKDSKWLMLNAIKSIVTPGSESRYGSYPCSVDGMQKSIHSTAQGNFKPLGTSNDYGYSREEVLFDVDKVGCKECKSMFKTHPFKTRTCMWCADPKCWEKNQKKHKEKRAAEAKKKMQEDILTRVATTETERQAKVGISQEIPSAAPIVDSIPEEEKGAAQERIKQLKDVSPNRPCLTCLSVGHCDGTGVYSVSGAGKDEVFACDNYMGKKEAKEVREKATLKVPPEVMELAKEKAGSRAEILDLNELRAGFYSDLKQGYVLLDNILDIMENSKECLETCTRGFHYAFDSKEKPSWRQEDENKVSYVCTDPKCVAKKKAAYTRALNAAGQAKKKVEMAAIKQAVTETVNLDHARMKVLVLSQLKTEHSYYSSDDKDINWFLNKLKIKPQKTNYGSTDHDKTLRAIIEAVDKLSEQELAKVIVEFTLMKLTYKGDIKQYKILTTESLNWLGIGVSTEKGDDKSNLRKKAK